MCLTQDDGTTTDAAAEVRSLWLRVSGCKGICVVATGVEERSFEDAMLRDTRGNVGG